MKIVIVASYKTRKAAEKYAADLASTDYGQYWNGREQVQVGSVNFRAVKDDGLWLVVRDWCAADEGRQADTLALSRFDT
jgi:hypothetical protein